VFHGSQRLKHCNRIVLSSLGHMLSAITFGPNRLLVNSIQELSASLGDLWIYKTLYSYPSGHELVQLLNIFSPEVVFLDIESSPAALDLAREIRASQPKTAIIGFTGYWDEERSAEATRAGVSEVLSAPCSTQTFQQAILKSIQAQTAGVPDNIVVFVPSKAGSGATTTALHVAAALAQDLHKRPLLLEADLRSGPLAPLLGLRPSNSTLDALESSQWMTDTIWRRLVTQAQGLDVLLMPGAGKRAMLSRWEYQRLLTFVRTRYDAVLVDLPELLDEATEAILGQAKFVYVVVAPERSSLFLARRRINELKAVGAADTRIRIVLNRCWQAEQNSREAEELLGRPVAVMLPNDELFLRRPISDTGLVSRESDLGRAFSTFARTIFSLESAPPEPPAPEAKASLRSLFRSRVLPQQS
jgi:pilus assembly protein CpaE